MYSVVIDSRELTRAMITLEARLRDMRGGMTLVGAEAVRMQHRHFDRRKDALGRRWPPLKPVTVILKGSSKPLADKGLLKNAIVAAPPARQSVVVYVKKLPYPKRTRQESEGDRDTEKVALVHQKGRVARPRTKRVMARELTRKQAKSAIKAAAFGGAGHLRVSRSREGGKDYVIFGKRARIPRRQFFYANLGERRKLADILARWLAKEAGARA